MPSTRISELSSLIAANTEKIDNYYATQCLSSPSFDVNPSKELALPREIEVARTIVIDASAELQAILLGPKEFLHSQVPNNLVSLHAVSHYQIAKHFPVDHEATYEDIAKACGLEESYITRILRHATTNHIFKEVRKGVIVHTAVSQLLAEDPQMQAWVSVCCEEMWPAAVRTVEAMAKWPNSQEAHHTGFALANNTNQSMYLEMARFPERAMRFAEGLSTYLTEEGYELRHILDNYPWTTVQGTVVDIGGSRGEFGIALARKFNSLQCVVQDLPDTIAGCIVPSDIGPRLSYMAHNFFDPQPVRNADVYFFRWIFHNWSDKYSIQILQQLIPALKHNSVVLINEYCLPEPNTLPREKEKHIRLMDLSMLSIQNSQERGLDDWVNLLKKADKRFKLIRTVLPVGSKLHIIEVGWEPDRL